MKVNILALMNKIDNPERYNYQVNFGYLDAMCGLNGVNIIKYDIEELAENGRDLLLELVGKYEIHLVTGPLRKRWSNAESLPRLIKNAGLPLVIFDNDSFNFDFTDEFYSYFDWIFYKIPDKNNDTPSKGSYLPWSIDTTLYSPKYGGNGTVLCATIAKLYPMRIIIRDQLHPHLVNCSKYSGKQYINHLQSSQMAINTNSRIEYTAAKLIEIAACGTAILTEDSIRLEYYFDKDLLFIFKDVDELKYYINHAQSNPDEIIYKQKMLRETVENRHTNTIRAREILEVLEKKVLL